MKTIALFLGLYTAMLLALVQTNCPVGGDNSNSKFQHLDSLKNRNTVSSKIKVISIDTMLKAGDDTKRFSVYDFVELTGIVYEVKYGGAETCNCHTDDKNQLDVHIELIRDYQSAGKTKRVIVEVNRYTRASDKTMTYDYIKSLKGKKVKINGWLFFDEEHKHNAYNTRPDGTNLWRATCWEIHPCMSIKPI